MQKGARKWTFKKQYSAFAITLINSTLAKKNVPQVREYFQDIWKETQTWKFEMLPQEVEGGAGAAAPLYLVHVNLPPYCSLEFNDVSIMQALGFDLINSGRGIKSRIQKTDRSVVYYLENNTNQSKLFTGDRPIPNMPIYKLRAVAKRERARLAGELRANIPMIENESDELDTTWELTYISHPPPEVLTYDAVIEAEPADPRERLSPLIDFFRQTFWYLSQHTGIDYDVFSFERSPSDDNAIRLRFNRPNLLDRFTVSLEFGPNALKRMPRLANYVKFNWNLGRNNSVDLVLLPNPLTAAERAELKRLQVEAANAAEEARRKNLGPQPIVEEDIVMRPARPTVADVVVVEKTEVKVLDPFGRPQPTETEEILEPVATGVFEQPTPEDVVQILAEPPKTIKKTEPPRAVTPPVIRPDSPPTVIRGGTPPPARGWLGPVIDEPVVVGVGGGGTAVIHQQQQPAVIGGDGGPAVEPTTPPAGIHQQPDVDAPVVIGGVGGPVVQAVEPTTPVVIHQQQPVVDVDVVLPTSPTRSEAGESGEESEGEGHEPEGANLPPPPPPRTPSPFRRQRMRFLVGNAPRKRRWNRREDDESELPEGIILVLENAEREDDYITDYGRCCIAASVLNGRILSKNKCFVDWNSLQHLTFQVFDSKHLSLLRCADTQLVKIELLVYN